MSPRTVLSLTLVGAVAWACHDAPSAWEPVQDGEPAGPRQLTFNPGDDRSPAWSAGGESILYVAESFGELARSDAVLLVIPKVGGAARTLFPLVQPEGAIAADLFAPAAEPDGDRVAYLQLLSTGGSACTADSTTCDPSHTLAAPPHLGLLQLRARTRGAATAPDTDPTLRLELDGVELDDTRHPFNLPGVWVTRLHPFQRRYNDEGILPSRASWEPGGERLVTGDGLGLFWWRPSDGAMGSIPGTDDGSSPAWSPDGVRIAFTRLERGSELFTTCQHLSAGKGDPVVSCVEERSEWPIARALVAIVPAVGGEALSLAEGTEPAWSPDGAWIYFARPDGIWRIAVAGGVPEPVAGAEGGSEPAVSPDGTELAFTRQDGDGKGDIWIVPLAP